MWVNKELCSISCLGDVCAEILNTKAPYTGYYLLHSTWVRECACVHVCVCVFIHTHTHTHIYVYSRSTLFKHLHIVGLFICRRIMVTFIQGVSLFSFAVTGLHLPTCSVTNHMSCKMEHTSVLLHILRTTCCPCVITNLKWQHKIQCKANIHHLFLH